MASSDFILFKNINKTFGRRIVLRHIDLDVAQGETLVIFGASGSGKTVLVSMMVGLNTPDSGKIFIDNQEITKFRKEEEWNAVRLKVGYLFQGSALFDSMSARENVAFPLMHHTRLGRADVEKKVDELLELVRLEKLDDKMPSELSGGMQRRLALARTLALSPKIIIYDEPTAGLDPINSEAIGHLIRDMQRQLGVTSLVVTHDMRLAHTVADRMALMHQGHILVYGTVEEIRRSSDPVVQQMLSGSTMETH